MSAAYNLTDEPLMMMMMMRNPKLQANLTASHTCTNTRAIRECSFLSFLLFFFLFAQIHTFYFLRRIFFFNFGSMPDGGNSIFLRAEV